MIDKTLFAVSTDETRFNLSGVYVETWRERRASHGRDRWSPPGDDRPRRGGREDAARRRSCRARVWPRSASSSTTPSEAELTLMVAEKDVRLHTPAVVILHASRRRGVSRLPSRSSRARRARRRGSTATTSWRPCVAPRSWPASGPTACGCTSRRARLELSASNPEQGEASEDLEVSYSGDPISIGFNARYLLEVLGVHAQRRRDRVRVSPTRSVPGCCADRRIPNYTYVVMPMRL